MCLLAAKRFADAVCCAVCCVLQADEQLSQFDWDDAEGNMRRRLASLAQEKQRKEQAKLNRRERRDDMGGAVGRAKKH